MVFFKEKLTFSHENVLNLSILGWLSFIVIAIVYCSLIYTYVTPAPINLIDNASWVFREWSLWMLLTPIYFHLLRKFKEKNNLTYFNQFYTAMTILSLVIMFQLSVSLFIDESDYKAILIDRLPKHILALLMVTLFWHIKFKVTKNTQIFHAKQQASSNTTKQIGNIKAPTIMVNKGADKCIIKVNTIDAVSAYGNYVEIFSNNEQYLYRSTLKSFFEIYLDESFIQTHRSNIVNVKAIDRIKMQTSGNGLILLKSGIELTLSKRYRRKFTNLKLAS